MNQEFMEKMKAKCWSIFNEASKSLESREVVRYPTMVCIVSGGEEQWLNVSSNVTEGMVFAIEKAQQGGASAIFMITEMWMKDAKNSGRSMEEWKKDLAGKDLSTLPDKIRCLACSLRFANDDGFLLLGSIQVDKKDTKVLLLGEYDKSAGNVTFPIPPWGS